MTSTEHLRANPLGKTIGLQLYTVSEQLTADFDGTLQKIAAIGYKQVELAQTFNKSASELKTAFGDHGLTCRSAHMFDFQKTPAQFMDFARELGVSYVVTSFNPPPSAFAGMQGAHPDMGAVVKALQSMTLDDYKRSAETCNQLGTEAKARGLQYAYHNHNLEFKKLGDVVPFDLLLASTDPKLVSFEMDCGWVVAAGQSPVAYLEKYPERIRLLHIKNFKSGPPSLTLMGPGAPTPTELGKGGIDYRPIFAAAQKAGVDQYYVEQEPPFSAVPALEAIKIDYDYIHGLS